MKHVLFVILAVIVGLKASAFAGTILCDHNVNGQNTIQYTLSDDRQRIEFSIKHPIFGATGSGTIDPNQNKVGAHGYNSLVQSDGMPLENVNKIVLLGTGDEPVVVNALRVGFEITSFTNCKRLRDN